MDGVDLNDLPVFLALSEAGSFTVAADRLGCSKTRVSLVIRRLEAALGASLFHRTTRQVRLTPAGHALRRACLPVLDELGQTLSGFRTASAELAGSLCVSAPEDYAERILAPAVLAFQARHPGVAVELRCADQVADMVAEGIDLAIRVGWLRDSSLRATRLGEFDQYLLASPAYLRRRGMPASPEDLKAHAWVAFTPLVAPLTWTFRRQETACQVRMHAALAVNSTGVLRSLLLQGAGLSVMTAVSASPELESGRLVRVLSDWHLPSGGIHAVYPPGRHLSAAARAFAAFLKDRGMEPPARPGGRADP
ncbi:MAG TPA: LysR family transcriptional regulator [Castellaniella sp.]|nr:LysR family transcriptional regulator [Castellaniella sp.]